MARYSFYCRVKLSNPLLLFRILFFFRSGDSFVRAWGIG
jgi:hypothetical protein